MEDHTFKMGLADAPGKRRRWQKWELHHLQAWVKEQDRKGTRWKNRAQNWLNDMGTWRSAPAIQAQWYRLSQRSPSSHSRTPNRRVPELATMCFHTDLLVSKACTEQRWCVPRKHDTVVFSSPVTNRSPPSSDTVLSSREGAVASEENEIPWPIQERFYSLIQFGNMFVSR